MQLKTILNRVQRFKSFVYTECRWDDQAFRPTLLVTIEPRRNSRPVCSSCGRCGGCYDHLTERRFEFVPLWGIAVFMADLSMIESGQAIVRLFEVPLAELVDEAILRIVDQSDEKGLQIVRHVPEKIAVLCDRGLTKRVLVNLIHNAMKWSPENEAITIEAVNGADEVTIGVLDNGPGVPDDQVERIFERFYQVDSSRSRHEGGTGLGLAICKHIIEAQGGRIWAEGNSDGSGGRFRFTLLSAENHVTDDDDSQ